MNSPRTVNADTIVVGHVIRSSKFVYGQKFPDCIGVGLDFPYRCHSKEDREVEVEGKPIKVSIDADPLKFDGSDQTRSTALFVVEQRHKEIDDGTTLISILARRLASDGSYDAKGELISFVMQGFRCTKILEVEAVHLYKMVFLPTDLNP